MLGQYELVLLDPDAPERLLLVAPNLREAAERLDVDEGDLVTWVTVHEVTHAVQFTARAVAARAPRRRTCASCSSAST